MKNCNIRILIVDDEVKIVEVAKSYLEKEGYTVIEAYCGQQALEIFEKANPSLIILDLMLPDITGEDICKLIRKKSRIPIVMLTAKVEEDDILNGLNIGADDYMTKPFSPRQLIARVNAIIRRSVDDLQPLTSAICYNNDDLTIDNVKYEVRKKGRLVNLTPCEYKILMCLVKYPKKVFSREELITVVLGEDYDGFDRTIDSHIKNLRQKIETDTKYPKYIMTVHGIGYRFGGE
ncbi:MAG: response regulator transcription factor [Bacillota bacterium]